MEKKFLKIAIIMVLLVFVYATVASALSFTATMTPSSSTVPQSTEFTVAVKVSNLDVGANGINSLSGYLKYDDDVFEKIGSASIDGMNGWSPSYNPDNEGKITLTKTSFVNSEESVFQITFKTKSELDDGRKGQIQFTNIMASNSASEINASDISITITIGEASADGNSVEANLSTNTNTNTSKGNTTISIADKNTNKNTDANTNTNQNTNSNTNKNANTNKNTNVNANTNKNSAGVYNGSTNESSSDIPYTGVEDTIFVLMIGIVAVAIVFYIKFERINKEMK
jgi:hypothetical protein